MATSTIASPGSTRPMRCCTRQRFTPWRWQQLSARLAAIRGYATHPADKQSLSGTVGVAHVLLFLLPMRQRNERLEVGPVEIDSELHCFSLR